MAEKSPTFIHTGLPEWMLPKKRHQGPPYTEHVLVKIFEWIADGKTYAALLREDSTMPSHGEFYRHLQKNPNLMKEYHKAQEAGIEVATDLGMERSQGLDRDGLPTLTDPQIIREEVGYVKWLASKRSPDRYGDKKQIDVNTKIDLTGAMEDAERRRLAHLEQKRITVIDNDTGEIE